MLGRQSINEVGTVKPIEYVDGTVYDRVFLDLCVSVSKKVGCLTMERLDIDVFYRWHDSLQIILILAVQSSEMVP